VPQLAAGIEAVHLVPQAGVITSSGAVILAPASAVTILDAAIVT
jgi:hypothetical protein